MNLQPSERRPLRDGVQIVADGPDGLGRRASQWTRTELSVAVAPIDSLGIGLVFPRVPRNRPRNGLFPSRGSRLTSVRRIGHQNPHPAPS